MKEFGYKKYIQSIEEKEIDNHRKEYGANWWQGISSEFFALSITTIFFAIPILVLQQYNSIQSRQADLILQMGSPNNDFAIEAVRQLRAEGWIHNGVLRGVDLAGANLEGANLESADLRNADLSRANFAGADLRNADLSRANLFRTNLQGADLDSANLTDANLPESDLTDANLIGANLTLANLAYADLTNIRGQGANLLHANLFRANINPASFIFDRYSNRPISATFPEGNDVRASGSISFTDPDHPRFWNPCIEVTPMPWYCQQTLIPTVVLP